MDHTSKGGMTYDNYIIAVILSGTRIQKCEGIDEPMMKTNIGLTKQETTA